MIVNKQNQAITWFGWVGNQCQSRHDTQNIRYSIDVWTWGKDHTHTSLLVCCLPHTQLRDFVRKQNHVVIAN